MKPFRKLKLFIFNLAFCIICSTARVTYHQQLCLEYDKAYKQQIRKCMEVNLDRTLCEQYQTKLEFVQEKFIKANLRGSKNTGNSWNLTKQMQIQDSALLAKILNTQTNLTF